jgi:very-short-patch-repair endonuclease
MLKELPDDQVEAMMISGRLGQWERRREKEDYAEKLRARQTEQELKLGEFLATKPKGWVFRPQVVIAGYIVDFYCAPAKTVIECDGAFHNEDRDARRDSNLWARKNLQTLRFTNDEIDFRFDDVTARIMRYLPDRKPRKRQPRSTEGNKAG